MVSDCLHEHIEFHLFISKPKLYQLAFPRRCDTSIHFDTINNVDREGAVQGGGGRNAYESFVEIPGGNKGTWGTRLEGG